MTIRDFLRSETAGLHAQLDAMVEPLFATPQGYRSYLAANHGFRSAIEPAAHAEGWAVQHLVPFIAQDLADLSTEALPPQGTLEAASAGHMAGRLYVLEGSAVGARLLYRQAQSMGFAQGFGARHLHAQQDDRLRWRAFLAWLEGQSDIGMDEARAGAVECFALAIRAYGTRP